MKTMRNIFLSCAVVMTALFTGCQKSETSTPDTGILPAHFKVDIPSALSEAPSATKSAKVDTLKGNAIYLNLRTFIAVGEGAGDIVEKIIGAIAYYKIDKPMIISYQSDDDKRTKNLVVKENQDYNNRTWKYMLSITDAASENDADGGKAMQVFWNQSPIEGIAVLKPYNIDRLKNADSPQAIFRIEYSEVADDKYDSHMIVDIAGLSMPDPQVDPYALHSLKMYVGKKGNNVDVFGNSDHPNAKFFTTTTGFDWAFTASGLVNENIGVAEVGLPPSTLDNTTRKVLLEDYSIKNVLTTQINQWFYDTYKFHIDQADLALYLKNADAPGYFGNGSFIQAGTAPDAKYTDLASRIKSLIPYSPKVVNTLTVDFK